MTAYEEPKYTRSMRALRARAVAGASRHGHTLRRFTHRTSSSWASACITCGAGAHVSPDGYQVTGEAVARGCGDAR